jgi:hypothetical protein
MSAHAIERGKVRMLPNWLVLGSVIVAAIVAFLFLMDLFLSIPFGRPSTLADILFVLSAAAILYLGWETYRDVL